MRRPKRLHIHTIDSQIWMRRPKRLHIHTIDYVDILFLFCVFFCSNLYQTHIVYTGVSIYTLIYHKYIELNNKNSWQQQNIFCQILFYLFFFSFPWFYLVSKSYLITSMTSSNYHYCTFINQEQHPTSPLSTD